MMLSDAYPRLFSHILAYPASWHVSVPIVLLFSEFPLTSFLPHWYVSVPELVLGSPTRFRVALCLFTYVSVCCAFWSYSPSYPYPSPYFCSTCFFVFKVFVPVFRSLSCTVSCRSRHHFFWSCCNYWCRRHGSPR